MAESEVNNREEQPKKRVFDLRSDSIDESEEYSENSRTNLSNKMDSMSFQAASISESQNVGMPKPGTGMRDRFAFCLTNCTSVSETGIFLAKLISNIVHRSLEISLKFEPSNPCVSRIIYV
ncbi:hypothetical protein LOTGIDRAFT_171741 [Lottia gigantea]|uniref:Uncharacterized protein n=1 Tax=Lottia gigantea TaxID=225164 RepID=V4CLG3_LOTGI|nr:hypothetical protein LOTGIDRAFT_171741 [Lottia gigantea]ESP03135.1 hypothetical protein LOTGIDRAFT_171741 [Lottia gigantea]